MIQYPFHYIITEEELIKPSDKIIMYTFVHLMWEQIPFGISLNKDKEAFAKEIAPCMPETLLIHFEKFPH